MNCFANDLMLKNVTVWILQYIQHQKTGITSFWLLLTMENIKWQLHFSCVCFTFWSREQCLNVRTFVFRVIILRPDRVLKLCYQLSDLFFHLNSALGSKPVGLVLYGCTWKQWSINQLTQHQFLRSLMQVCLNDNTFFSVFMRHSYFYQLILLSSRKLFSEATLSYLIWKLASFVHLSRIQVKMQQQAMKRNHITIFHLKTPKTEALRLYRLSKIRNKE